MNESVYVQHPDIQGYYAAKADLGIDLNGVDFALYERSGTSIRHIGMWNRGPFGVGWYLRSDVPGGEADED